MNRNTYQATRRSIRDTDTLLTCDDLINIMKETDWLSMRQQFARDEKPSIAFKLTTKTVSV